MVLVPGWMGRPTPPADQGTEIDKFINKAAGITGTVCTELGS
jgi:hypothetical protein